ncbi:alpha/beta fold hydrolase [Rugamonas sp. FT107W]|uniref:Alpha/beta fold hydrolase n=1 Tax=Duganella vulcania TaxID=2692166 RepID=A0A845HDR8_9BURK|nr:alpha/beta fold hydrolase [Duganella vulcania]MYN17362.1 alpha/beta fold hydrolase [Duganella vulcania]
MATFVLLHGSFHAAWNWHKLIPLLEAAGHRAVALDLPAHGKDRTAPRHATLAHCVTTVLDCVAGLDAPVLLVAHSRNGIVISQAAEQAGGRIAGLVYLAAYLVPDGRAMMDYALLDAESLVARNVSPPLDARRAARLLGLFRSGWLRWLLPRLLPASLQTHRLKRAVYREALYHDCPDDITALAEALLESEPNWAGFTPLRLSEEAYGRVPRIYIECLQDRAVTIGLQRRMQRDSGCAQVYSLDSGHSPFFSQPAALARLLELSVECCGR